LALRNLTVISDTVKLIKEKEPEFDIDKISYEDKDTFKMLANGNTEGVFQFESAKRILREAHQYITK
jgi:DNA polymerase-3 subunit alpha